MTNSSLLRFNPESVGISRPFAMVMEGGFIVSIACAPDGKILISGQFAHVDGVARNGIARLNADGSVDTTFDTAVIPLRLAVSGRSSDGSFHGVVYGRSGRTCTIQTSPDLVDWANLETLLIPEPSQVEFADPIPDAAPHRFYRLRGSNGSSQ